MITCKQAWMAYGYRRTITLDILETQEIAELAAADTLRQALSAKPHPSGGFDNTKFSELLWKIHSQRVQRWYSEFNYHERAALRRTPQWLSK